AGHQVHLPLPGPRQHPVDHLGEGLRVQQHRRDVFEDDPLLREILDVADESFGDEFHGGWASGIQVFRYAGIELELELELGGSRAAEFEFEFEFDQAFLNRARVSSYGGRARPRSVMMAAIREAGVTSKAGL